MAIKINITQTESGYSYFNADRKKVIATIKEDRNEPGFYLWQIFNGECGFTNLEQSHYMIRGLLSQQASNLGCDIEFINRLPQ